MACNPQRFVNLPIPDQMKQMLMAFSADPANDAASTELCALPDEVIVQQVSKMAGQQPPGQPPAAQGIGGLPPQTSAGPPAGLPPGQMADVPAPMDTPPPQSSNGMTQQGLGGLLNNRRR